LLVLSDYEERNDLMAKAGASAMLLHHPTNKDYYPSFLFPLDDNITNDPANTINHS